MWRAAVRALLVPRRRPHPRAGSRSIFLGAAVGASVSFVQQQQQQDAQAAQQTLMKASACYERGEFEQAYTLFAQAAACGNDVAAHRLGKVRILCSEVVQTL